SPKSAMSLPGLPLPENERRLAGQPEISFSLVNQLRPGLPGNAGNQVRDFSHGALREGRNRKRQK
ncbi:MAG: hypothetical protein Q8N47_18840, partial [Bryobacterales bacterium]|nr:hypothetical protein [Bryobacterales bacterium]